MICYLQTGLSEIARNVVGVTDERAGRLDEVGFDFR